MTSSQITPNQTIPTPAQPRPIVSIGAGGIVHDAHYPAYALAKYPVIGLYDPDQARAAYMAEKFRVPRTFESLAAAVAFAPANAIFDVAVPASRIGEILPGLPAGAAVLIQKPLGDNLPQARNLLQICQARDLTAAVNFQLRWAPFVLAARSLIEQGAIGQIVDLEVRVNVLTPWHMWPFLQQIPHAEIYYHSIHYVDLFRSFLGEPKGVWAHTVAHPELAEMRSSKTSLIFDYGPEARVQIETNHFHKYGLAQQDSYIKWEGTKGAIKATMGILMDYPQGQPDRFQYCLLQGEQNPNWQEMDLHGSWFPEAFTGSMGSLMRFLDGESAELPTSVADAARTMAVAEAACRSSDSGLTLIQLI